MRHACLVFFVSINFFWWRIVHEWSWAEGLPRGPGAVFLRVEL